MRAGDEFRGDPMRLVIDLQGAQGSNAKRGIGRFCRELALAMARQPVAHDVIIALNGGLPTDPVRESFAAILPRENIRIWHGPGGTAEANAGAAPKRRAAEAMRAEFLVSLRPDLLHVGSIFEGWSDDVVTAWPSWRTRVPVVTTGHDLIPLIRRADYLDGAWKHNGLSQWYLRCLQEMRLSDAILTNSDSTRSEMIEYLGCDPQHVFTILAGVGAEFRPPNLTADERDQLLRRLGLRTEYILFLGAGDIRKNEDGLIRAYGLLPKSMRDRHQMVIVGNSDDSVLRSTALAAGVDQSDLVLIPFVDDDDIPALFANSMLFVLPSFHEGFGLPAAEAMACGAPVIASNATSLPEVVGRNDALFDPSDPAAIAERMRAVLENPAFRQELVAHSVRQAATFTWANVANRAWAGLEATHARLRHLSNNSTVPGWRPRLAYVSPIPPQQSGIADYSAELIPELARHYDITIVADVPSTSNENLAPNFPVITPARFTTAADGFDRVLYQIGNSHFHADTLTDLLPRIPGMVTLHDAYLSGLCNWIAHNKHRTAAAFTEALYRSHGWPAVLSERRDGVPAAIRDYPCSLPVLQHAIGIIQHSRHGCDILAKYFGRDAIDAIHIIPHLRQRFGGTDRRTARARLGIPEDQFLVCSVGYVAPSKLPARLLAAWKVMTTAGARLVFVGQTDDGGVTLLKAAADGLGVPDEQIWTGHVDIDTYRTWLAATDVAVQLRTNSRGETSGAILDCMAAGVATVINDEGSASELPDDCVIRLPKEFTDAMLVESLRLLRDPVRRQRLVEKARRHVADALAPRHIATAYRAAIEAAYNDGPAAARYRTTQSLAYALPDDGGSVDWVAACARAVVRNFPPVRVPTLQIDVSAFPELRQDSKLGLLLTHLLSSHGKDNRVDLVTMSRGGWRHARVQAAALLGLPQPPAPDEPCSPADPAALVCIVPPDGWYEAELDRFRALQSAGVKLAVLFPARPRPDAAAAICGLTAHVFHLDPNDAQPINVWLARYDSTGKKRALLIRSSAELIAMMLEPRS